MQTKPKSNSVITHEVGERSITFNVAGAGSVTLDVGGLSKEVQIRAMLHGLIQRISDAAAISRDPATGQPASPQDKLAAMEALVMHYQSGTSEWGRKREGGGGNNEGGLLYRALCQLYPKKSPDDVRAFVKGKTSKERAALLASDKVKPIADSLRKQATSNINVDAILDELG